MGYSNETNVANEMKDSRRAVKVQTMLAAPLPSEDGQIYRVHILRNETPYQLSIPSWTVLFVQGFFYLLYPLSSSH